MNRIPPIVGVLGAGTMGAGIAHAAARAGARTLLHDPDAEALARAAVDGVEAATSLSALAGAELVIEAVPERLDLKREVLARVAAVVGPGAVLATNTSSLGVTAIAAGVPAPERVVGMHFFNPVARMRLVEVVAGEATGEHAVAVAHATAAAMGKTAVDAADVPGFLVNRCNRPFSLEALRLVQERIATPEQIDRICRLAGGFRMGPFELMDLVGLDVGLAVAESLHAQSYGEPRWRPSPLAARLVAAGRLGRKTGHGWYRYPGGAPADPPAPPAGGGEGRLLVLAGETALAGELHEAAADAGWDVATPGEAVGELPALIVDCGATEEDPPLQGAPQLILCDHAPLAALDPAGTAVGFHALVPLGGLVELTSQPSTPGAALAAAEAFFATLGLRTEHVGDAPGLVLGRIVAQLVNEACFALGEGVGSAAGIDAGMVLGLNHPRGPLEWAETIGPGAVLSTLAGLEDEYREDRYRPAPALVRAIRQEAPLLTDGG
jgi:3-hydroxybutyryl-CoA dehydrogenase